MTVTYSQFHGITVGVHRDGTVCSANAHCARCGGCSGDYGHFREGCDSGANEGVRHFCCPESCELEGTETT